MKSVSAALLALAASAAAAPADELFARAACNADNCLRAIRNTARPGLADCNSYLQATFTPATVTLYETLSFTTTPTDTLDVTATETELATATATEEDTTTTTATNPVTVAPWKRQATEFPSAFPSYASPCTVSATLDAARFKSACACLGATSTTITVAAPVTVITVSETATPTTETETVTVKTETETVTDATVTETVIVETATVTTDHPVATIAEFKLKASSSNHQGQYLRFDASSANNGKGNVKFGTTVKADASQFVIKDGLLYAHSNTNGQGDLLLNYPTPVNHAGYAIIEAFANTPPNRRPLTCEINQDARELWCGAGQSPAGFVDCSDSNSPQWFTGVGARKAACVDLRIAVEYN